MRRGGARDLCADLCAAGVRRVTMQLSGAWTARCLGLKIGHPGGPDSMRVRAIPYCLLALLFIAGCSGKGGTAGLGRDAAASASATGGNAGGSSASASTAGVAGAFGSGGITGGGLGTGGSTGGGSAGMAGGGSSGFGGITQGGVSGNNTVDASPDDGGTDGAEGETGDPDPKALYALCRESPDEATCSARGGKWRTYSSFVKTCVCPTGEGGRPCTASSDCLGDCSAWMDPMLGNGEWCQKNVTGFTCSSEGGKQGCWCIPEPLFAVCYP